MPDADDIRWDLVCSLGRLEDARDNADDLGLPDVVMALGQALSGIEEARDLLSELMAKESTDAGGFEVPC